MDSLIVMCHYDEMMIHYALHKIDCVIQKHRFVRQNNVPNFIMNDGRLLIMYYIIKVLSCKNFIVSKNQLCLTE